MTRRAYGAALSPARPAGRLDTLARLIELVRGVSGIRCGRSLTAPVTGGTAAIPGR
jgi:hypothetical protein